MRRQQSVVISALRVAGDEYQLGRVLAALCTSPEVARAFLQVVLVGASENDALRDRVTDVRLPRHIACSPEHALIRTGRGAVRGQAKQLGRADLFFEARDFKLVVELKIDSAYRKQQIRRYLRSGAHVLSIVRVPGAAQLGETIDEDDRWLGEVSWAEIAEALASLPIAGKDREVWLDLLAVLEADGDFDPAKLRRATEADGELAFSAGCDALERLKRRRRLSSLELGLIRTFAVAPPQLGRSRGWADIVDEEVTSFFRVGVRRAKSRTPEIVFDWMPWSRQPPGSGQAAMHASLVDQHDFARMGGPGRHYYRAVRHLNSAPGIDVAKLAADWIYSCAAAVADEGLLRYDAERLGPG